MPIEGEVEDAWKYYVPQPIPDDAVAKAPESIHALKLLDPACGSGHFLVIAFDLLVKMYREEARHRGATLTDEVIAEAILANNLHGVDIDPRAIQVAAAALYFKAKTLSAKTRPQRVNLVAPTLQLGSLSEDDPSMVQLRKELKKEAGISEDLTRRLISALAGVDYLGTLLKVDSAVEEALKAAELEISRSEPGQGNLFTGYPKQQIKLGFEQAKASVLDKLERFLAKHSASEDLGLRLDGEQLASGVRFVRMVKEGTYDVVVGNPPYQAVSKTAASDYVTRKYSRAKADLYAAFLERAVELAKEGGLSGLLTMRGWMFLGQFSELRAHLLRNFDLRSIGDFDRGAFDEVPNEVLAVAAPVFRRGTQAGVLSVATQPTSLIDKSYDRQRTNRKRAAVLAQVGRYEFDPKAFKVIEGEPIVYWWSKEFLATYAAAPKFGAVHPARQGLGTRNDTRFVRQWWEVRRSKIHLTETDGCAPSEGASWVPFIKGAAGLLWVEPLDAVLHWDTAALVLRAWIEHYRLKAPGQYIKNERYYFLRGVAFTTIGNSFGARVHRFPSVFGEAGSSVFAHETSDVLCAMNRTLSRRILESLNPTVNFKTQDVNRLPKLPVNGAKGIVAVILQAFAAHEGTRECSIEFSRPGASLWLYAQRWAQRAVDRPDREPLPSYDPEYDPPAPESFVSFLIGVALGRFDANGEGILDEPPPSALPAGILFVSPEGRDSLEHPASSALHESWKEHGNAVGGGDDLRTYLRTSFFGYHKKLYENRPIYFPLSSAKKSYVAFVSIYRWKDDTLNVLLADHLVPEKRKLEGELDDLRKARAQASGKGNAEKRFAEVKKLSEELAAFIDRVTHIAECGPPPSDDKTTQRGSDARFVMDLDDGVMVNSAALWPLLEPQWKDPKKWWKELATAQGRKDYDWAHLAARYFPTRVREKCITDPSLAVAHKCFWELHPAKAHAWELRLQDEIKPDFTIDEPGSDAARARFLKEHAKQADETRAAEMKRRKRKAAKTDDADAEPLFDAAEQEQAHA